MANTTEHPHQNNQRRNSVGAWPGADSNRRHDQTKRKHTTAVTDTVDDAYDPNDQIEEGKQEGQRSINEITKGDGSTHWYTTQDWLTARHSSPRIDPSERFTYNAPHPKGSPTQMPVITQDYNTDKHLSTTITPRWPVERGGRGNITAAVTMSCQTWSFLVSTPTRNTASSTKFVHG